MVNAVMKTSGSASKAAGAGVRPHSSPTMVVVTAALLIATHHWRELMEITSSGPDIQWSDARLVCQSVLGYGASFRFVPKRRPPIPGETGTEPVTILSLEEM